MTIDGPAHRVAPVARPMSQSSPRFLAAFSLILLYVALVYVRPQEYSPELAEVPLLPVVMGAAFLVWLPGKGKSFEAPQFKLIIAFVVTMMLSVVVNGWLGGAYRVFADFFPVLVVFVMIATTANTLTRHRVFMAMLALACLLMAFHGIDQVQKGVGWTGVRLSQGTRITYLGIFRDPNDLALAFVMVLPMVAYCLGTARWFGGRLAWLAVMGTLIYGIYLTNSRGGMLAALSQAFIYAWRRLGTWAAVLGGLVGLAGLSMLPSRLEQLDADEESAASRVDAWYAGLQMLIRRPVFGVGKGNFTDYHTLTAHNSFVLVFSETGLVGYVLWLSFMLLSLWMVVRVALWNGDGSPHARQVQRVGITYAYALFGSLFAAFFLSRSYNMVLFIMCALCVAIYQMARATPSPVAQVAFKPVAARLVSTAVGSVLVLYVLVRVLLLR